MIELEQKSCKSMKSKPQLLLKTTFFPPPFYHSHNFWGKVRDSDDFRELQLFKYLQQTICISKCLPEEESQNMNAVTKWRTIFIMLFSWCLSYDIWGESVLSDTVWTKCLLKSLGKDMSVEAWLYLKVNFWRQARLFKQSLKDLQSQKYLYAISDRPKRVTLCCSMAWCRTAAYLSWHDIVLN